MFLYNSAITEIVLEVASFVAPKGLRLKKFKDHRYEGFAYGGGLSYGHQWMIAPKWNFELSLGAGYAYLTYDKYPCIKCGSKLESNDKHYLGVTKAAVSLIYLIK